MIKLTQATERFRKISKEDIIQFFKIIMNDKNLAHGLIDGTIDILSANYRRVRSIEADNDLLEEEYKPKVVNTNPIDLTIKFTLKIKSVREYYEMKIVRDRQTKRIQHSSVKRYFQSK